MSGLRPLGEIMTILEECGYTVSHAYDDLVLIEHMPFLLRFDEKEPKTLYFYSHVDWDEERHTALFQGIKTPFDEGTFILVDHGRFDLKESASEKESIDITFYDHSVTSQ